MGEGYRAYLRRPGWFKKVAPNAARRIRAHVNPNPKVNRYIQFNTIVPASGAGIGAWAILSGEEETREPRL
jgi:hypothetical protein